jgi:predicted permease
MWSDFLHRARAIFRRKTVEREMDDELRFHIERQTEKHMRAGLRPEEAARQARLDFGGREQVREDYRDSLGISLFETIAQDVRYTLRAMRANPAFTLVAVVSLALAIGANTAIFSLVNVLMLRDLRVASPEALVEVGRLSQYGRGNFSYPIYERIRDGNTAFSGVLAISSIVVEATADDAARPLLGRFVSQNFFQVLGIAPVAGRLFSDDSTLAVITHRLWQQEFAGSPDIIGKTLQVQPVRFTIAGVLPPSFDGLVEGRPDDFFLPMASHARIIGANWLDKPDFNWLAIVGRLKTGASEQAARANLDGIFGNFIQEFASAAPPEVQRQLQAQRLTLESARAGLSTMRQQLSRPAQLLLGAVGLVLLIACANVAGLLLTRGVARRREIAVRMAIGAGRRRLIQQLLTESAALGLMGGSIGLLLAHWGGRIIAGFIADGNPAISFDLTPDGRVLLFTVAISLGAALVAGLGPALRSTRSNLAPAMHGELRANSVGRASMLWSRGLIAGQLALSLLLLIGASLLLTSLRNLFSFDPGFDREHVLLVGIRPDRGVCTGVRCLDYYRQVLERTRTAPGVRASGLSFVTPMGGGVDLSFAVQDRPAEPPAMVYVNAVSDGYFAAIGTPLLVGRDFTSRDGADSPPVAVINDALARRFFKHENPIGRRVRLGRQDGLEIVGVVANSKYMSLREEDQPIIYVDALQKRDTESLNLAVRTYDNPIALEPAIRAVVQPLAADVRVRNASTLSAQIDRSLGRERLMMRILTGFAGVGLLLTAVGFYAALAFNVSRRTSEIGLRLALGETHRSVLWSVLREASLLVGIGVAIGVPAAFGLTRLLSNLLYGVTPTDPWVLARAVAVLFITAVVAALQPAWRALRIDPLVALRHE